MTQDSHFENKELPIMVQKVENFPVPVRRMKEYCEKHKIMWALDKNVPMPTEDKLRKLPIEHEPKSKGKTETGDDPDAEDIKKMFPFRLRIHPKYGNDRPDFLKGTPPIKTMEKH